MDPREFFYFASTPGTFPPADPFAVDPDAARPLVPAADLFGVDPDAAEPLADSADLFAVDPDRAGLLQ